jgi:hypothetical protein
MIEYRRSLSEASRRSPTEVRLSTPTSLPPAHRPHPKKGKYPDFRPHFRRSTPMSMGIMDPEVSATTASPAARCVWTDKREATCK